MNSAQSILLNILVTVQYLHSYHAKSMRIGFADGILHFSSPSYALGSKCFGLVLNSYIFYI